MLDDDNTSTTESEETTQDTAVAAGSAPAKKTAAKKAPARKRTTKQAQPAPETDTAAEIGAPDAEAALTAESAAQPAEKTAVKKAAAKKTAAKRTTAKKTTSKKAAAPAAEAPEALAEAAEAETEATDTAAPETPARSRSAAAPPVALLFQAPEPVVAPKRTRKTAVKPVVEEPEVEETEQVDEVTEVEVEEKVEKKAPRQQSPRAKQGGGRNAPRKDRVQDEDEAEESEDESEDENGEGGDSESAGARRRRRRGGRRRRKPSDGETDESDDNDTEDASGQPDDNADGGEGGEGSGTRRRRRRVREGEAGESGDDPNTVVRVRKPRSAEDEITSLQGSTRLEAKKQRRREGREAGRRRAPIVSEAEFLARRESVDRVMVIRQRDDLTQIAVLEDKVLVEHYVARESQTSLIGNVYVGRVQNVLPSMEAAFVDIGKGRNAVLYAGEVNWSALGHKDGQPRKIESVLSSGQSVLVQVTKDPVGHKGARLTSQVSLAGRFLVYVPDGTTSGISRKLPDTERSRLKALLKEIVPDTAGVIVRTAAEGASEEELTRDVERLKARWEDIEAKAKSGNAPQLLYGEPDLTLKVVRDLFTEDFTKLVIQGDDAWDTVQDYVAHVAPDLQERLERYDAQESGDVFGAYRIDEQIAKGLDRKVWLPSGGSLIIDRTEAMTVVDVNTGKFTGSGGNLEETVTKNNLEAAEEMVRQLRLRDIGGIIVVDFIDMVLESNRDLVLRRLVECLGRDRTRHQVAEVTSLGLVQMTRKRIGTGLVEAFSENCEHCQGRGVVIHDAPVESRKSDDGADRRGRRARGRSGAAGGGNGAGAPVKPAAPSPKSVAAVARPENADRLPLDEVPELLVDGAAPVEEPTSLEEVVTGTRTSREPGKRSARRSSRPAAAAAESAPAASEQPALVETPAVEPQTPEPQTPEPQTPEPQAAEPQPAEPAAPKVVTRTRRAASRPAGASSATTQLEPVAIVVSEPAAGTTAHTPVVEPPKVVTRTRRAVSRPAGAASAAADAAVDGSGEGEHAGPELHVPIKKKGARKR